MFSIRCARFQRISRCILFLLANAEKTTCTSDGAGYWALALRTISWKGVTRSWSINNFPRSWTGAIVSEVVLGPGFGAYLAVNQVLATQVLPSNSDRAKDMGIINISNTLPQTLAPAIAALILTLTHSYLVLFVLAGIVTLIGSFIVQPIKSVR